MNIIAWLKPLLQRQSPLPDIPQSAEHIGDYRVNFERAAEFTSACGFPRIKVKWRAGDVIDEKGSFLEPSLRAAGVRDLRQSACQCLKWCHFIAPSVQKELGCNVWLTMGQIWRRGKPVFNPTWADMKRWCNSGFGHADFAGRKGFNLHAWLTLDSGEIIDPTYFSSLAMANPEIDGKMSGAVAWGRDPQAIENHRYFPMAVGSAFAEAIDAKSVVPLLATTPEELPEIPCYFVPDDSAR